jgi:hypothetical protein
MAEGIAQTTSLPWVRGEDDLDKMLGWEVTVSAIRSLLAETPAAEERHCPIAGAMRA